VLPERAVQPGTLPALGERPSAAEARRWLIAQRAALKAAFFAHPDPRKLLAQHSAIVDTLLKRLWASLDPGNDLALVAVGGYGRARLFPCSDVDVLVLLPDDAGGSPVVEKFIGLLWDAGLDPGHSVRSVAECVEEAAKDVTVDTSLLESRLIAGNAELLGVLMKRLKRRRKVREFFDAKYQEQKDRHARFMDVAYNLEPNVKESPGGLRDLQTIVWLARAIDLGETWPALAREGLLTKEEARQVNAAQLVLTDLRVRLHYLAGRREDRLVFDHQIEIARQLGLKEKGGKVASDLLMQRYYVAAKAIWRFNVILLGNLFTRITPPSRIHAKALDANFEIVNNALELTGEHLFEKDPGQVLEAFLRLQQNPDVVDFSADTLRALYRALPRLDKAFRDDPENRARFMRILRSERLTWTLRRMSRYGVLGRYLPAFGRIVGLMQHDLFHVYSVDEHILMVIRNLRRFRIPRFDHEYPYLSGLMQSFEPVELLYVAALYHDIAKGRGGDHSGLGARDARRFCKQHGLSQADADLVAWLVDHHLTMSSTAQKQDLSDPEVIAAFAQLAGTEHRLTALYILTVADVRGTSPTVWNEWKGKLLEDLFRLTQRVLRGEADNALWVGAKREEALRIFQQYVPEPGREAALWSHLDDAYFRRFEAGEIGWHTRTLWSRATPDKPIVRARLSPVGEGVQVLVYCPDQPGIFARITGFFERHKMDIVAAKIYTTTHGFALDTFQVLSRARAGEHYRDLLAAIEAGLVLRLAPEAEIEALPTGRVSRWVKHFPIVPRVAITPDRSRGRYQLSISCADRPGLLSAVSRVFVKHGLNLVDARVTTLGARAEDVFVVNGPELEEALSREAVAEEVKRVLGA
jgi:[protein-PII] uridylyltransferase